MRKALLILAGVAMMGAFAQQAEAGAIIGACYTGDCESLTGSILVDFTNDTLDENDGAGDVMIVIKNLTNGFIDELGLRYMGGLSGSPAIEGFSASGSAAVPKLSLGTCQNDNSNQSLNVCFDFASKNSDRFNAGETVTLFVDSTSVDFIAALFDPAGGFAHVQGLPNGGSAKLVDAPPPTSNAVPEPSALLLLGSGIAAVAAARRRQKRRSGTSGDHKV